MEDLLKTCETDGLLSYIEKYMPKGSKTLESGAGAGRYVKYLHDRGWDIVGLELDEPTVKMVRKYWPELKMVLGDAADSPFKNNTFDGIISLGVIEHWTEGPEAPLKDMFRTLKPGGIALITAPSLNAVRKLKKTLWWNELTTDRVATKNWFRRNGTRPNRLNKDYKFWTYPTYGEFFEYRFNKKELRGAIKGAGFEIVEHRPAYEIDGLYHELNPKQIFVKYQNRQFIINTTGKILNKSLSLFPFVHSHHQLVIARKPERQPKKHVRDNT